MTSEIPLHPIAQRLGYNHPLFEWPLEGKCFGFSHWEKIEISIPISNGVVHVKGLLDTSTGSIYRRDAECTPLHLIVKCLLTNVVFSIHFVGSLVYNTLRCIVVIFYFTIHAFPHYFSQRKSSNPQTFKAVFINHMQILATECLRSIVNIVRAPYFALGIFFGLLYGLIDPWNGRKVVASFENAWNHHTPLIESFWMVRPMKECTLKMAGENSLYIPGCFQKVGFVENGKVYNARHVEKPERTLIEQVPAKFWLLSFFKA